MALFEHPKLLSAYGIPLGIDAPRAILEGLLARYRSLPPHLLARVTLIVNTARMARRLQELLRAQNATLHPRIITLDALPQLNGKSGQTTPELARRFELIELIASLLEAQPDLAPRAALFDLADSLASLLAEMQSENVDLSNLMSLDVEDQSGHWQRSLTFLRIISEYIDPDLLAQSAEARAKDAVINLTKEWMSNPPQDPIILAGSTGSRGITQDMMRLIASLDMGSVIVPGVDTLLSEADWRTIREGGEDHPQYRIAMLKGIILPSDAPHWPSWTGLTPNAEARQPLISLALCPAPVTDRWRREGPRLLELSAATQGISLIEAPTPRVEALCIAMRLRQAVEKGETAALITPNRVLTRQVTAALDHWGIVPDDSAGTPLHLTPPARILRLVAHLITRPITAQELLTLLKQPLTHSGSGRNFHLLFTRELELALRKNPPLTLTSEVIDTWAVARPEKEALTWALWIKNVCFPSRQKHRVSLQVWLNQLIDISQALAAGSNGEASEAGALWDQAAGRTTRDVLLQIEEASRYCCALSALEFSDLLTATLSREELRDRDAPHPLIKIWGTIEARVHGADVLILAGLNEASWPETAGFDPWLNRAMRKRLGLLVPERQIGLSAHDFQQALAMPNIWLSRSLRDDEAETVPSRWVNRLTNLLGGLKENGGGATLKAMRDSGEEWLKKAQSFEAVEQDNITARPSACPPVHLRPKSLSVTDIQKLIRDPYAIYCKYILNLRPLGPLDIRPDALMRGNVLHEIYEDFVKSWDISRDIKGRDKLLEIAQSHLNQLPWAITRLHWMTHLEASADWFIESEIARQRLGKPSYFEHRAVSDIEQVNMTLKAKADRIDVTPSGAIIIYDYKTGSPPSIKEQRFFDKQLLLEAAMVEMSGFGEMPPTEVEKAAYIGIGKAFKEVNAPLDQEPPSEVWAGLIRLLSRYNLAQQGYIPRRAMRSETDVGHYDHLSRFGAWDMTQEAQLIMVGDHD